MHIYDRRPKEKVDILALSDLETGTPYHPVIHGQVDYGCVLLPVEVEVAHDPTLAKILGSAVIAVIDMRTGKGYHTTTNRFVEADAAVVIGDDR